MKAKREKRFHLYKRILRPTIRMSKKLCFTVTWCWLCVCVCVCLQNKLRWIWNGCTAARSIIKIDALWKKRRKISIGIAESPSAKYSKKMLFEIPFLFDSILWLARLCLLFYMYFLCCRLVLESSAHYAYAMLCSMVRVNSIGK